jgi:hypothetical protein
MEIASWMCCGFLFNIMYFGTEIKNKDEVRLVYIDPEAPLRVVLRDLRAREEPVTSQERALIKQKFLEAKAQISDALAQKESDREGAMSPDSNMKKED